MAILDFLLGLCIGLVLLWWQRSRLEARLRRVLQILQSHNDASSNSSTTQLVFAVGQQQRIQQQLEQKIETYETALQHAPIGYLQVDDENRLIWCNSQARSILGISQETIPPKPRLLLELVRSYELDDLIEKTREADTLHQQDWTFYPASSDPSDLSEQPAYALRGYGLPLPEKQIGIFLENRQEAVDLIERCDRWASDLAHEFKTPLTSIRLVAETLQTRLEPPLKTWMERLINETMRLSDLVQDLLDLNRLQRDAFQSLRLAPVDLTALIHSVWYSLEPLAQKKQLSLDYQGPEQLVMQLDAARIHRLLVNLLDNSIKYSPPAEKIEVKVSISTTNNEKDYTGNQEVCLEVIDKGCGFTEKDLPYVFDRFYRADLSRTRQIAPGHLPPTHLNRVPLTNRVAFTDKQGIASSKSAPSGSLDSSIQSGSGLGLAIVRQIVVAHQGSVHASNHPDTGGAWLQVRLPWKKTAKPEAG